MHVEFFSNLADDCLFLGFTGFHFATRKFPFLGNVVVFGGAALDGPNLHIVETVEQSKAIGRVHSGAIVIAGGVC
jgi:hypothetical protein